MRRGEEEKKTQTSKTQRNTNNQQQQNQKQTKKKERMENKDKTINPRSRNGTSRWVCSCSFPPITCKMVHGTMGTA